jgi:hypothetical protein
LNTLGEMFFEDIERKAVSSSLIGADVVKGLD